MPFNIGPFELILVLGLVLLLLGPGKLPQVGSALGKTLREIRSAASDDEQVPAEDDARPQLSSAMPGSEPPKHSHEA